MQASEGQEDDDCTPLASRAEPGSTSAGGGGGVPLEARSSSGDGSGIGGDRDALEAEAQKAMKKLGSSKDFLESHLMRASVLTPLDPEDRGLGTPQAGAAGGAPQHQQQGGGGAPNGALPAAAEEEEEEEQQHAAGMGATAVTAIVRGNRVIVANTGTLPAAGHAVAAFTPERDQCACKALAAPPAGGMVARVASCACCGAWAPACHGPLHAPVPALPRWRVPVLQATRAVCCPSGARRARSRLTTSPSSSRRPSAS